MGWLVRGSINFSNKVSVKKRLAFLAFSLREAAREYILTAGYPAKNGYGKEALLPKLYSKEVTCRTVLQSELMTG
ncbi:MAG: hypothetical protein M3Q97_06255 [Bacteroidota bacterium]|nr:hypothetical protein [Bacteroidota bacterium]